MALGTLLKSRRKELGLTLLDVSKKVGVSEATVQRWESGNIKNLRHERITALADALDVSPAYLMGWTGDNSLSVELSGRDRRDIAGDLEDIMSGLDAGAGLMLDGSPASPEARESLKNAIEMALMYAKEVNKKKYDPTKNKKQ